MTLTSRVLVVDWASTFCNENKQTLGLILLDRDASAEFYKIFPDINEKNLAEVMSYAEEHAITSFGTPGSSLEHKRVHKVDGTDYHHGNIITEKCAYDFGYFEPHIDTVAGGIAQIYASCPGRTNDEFTALLREEGLIDEGQAASYKLGQIDVFSNERSREFTHYGPKVIEKNCASHPITLFVDRLGDDEVISAGVGFFVPEENGIFEFMTYAPVE